MALARDPDLCPVCGIRYEGSWHPCDGPRLDRIAADASRRADADLVLLPGDDPEDTAWAVRALARRKRSPERADDWLDPAGQKDLL